MVWIMRGLVAVALALGLVILIVLLIGNVGSVSYTHLTLPTMQ